MVHEPLIEQVLFITYGSSCVNDGQSNKNLMAVTTLASLMEPILKFLLAHAT